MSHRRAKKIRQELLPTAGGDYSRGQVIRAYTNYEFKPNARGKRQTLVLQPGCPKQIIQAVKRKLR